MSDKNDKNQDLDINDEKLEKRRKALKNILAGSGTVVTAAAMQDKWAKPVIESVVLPAHAQTSGSVVPGAFTASTITENQNDLLDVLVPAANAVPCNFQLCINVKEDESVEIQVIDESPVATGNGNLDSLAAGIMLSNGATITGKVTGTAPNRKINGNYSGGNCFSGAYPEAVEAGGSCSLSGKPTPPPPTTGAPSTTTTTSTPPPVSTQVE